MMFSHSPHSDSQIIRAIGVLVNQVNERTKIIMADLNSLQAEVSQFISDVTAALARAQASIDALNNAGLTPAQQAIVDALANSVSAADASVQAFDVTPTGTGTGTSTATATATAS